jgi:hypothetical protein
MYGTSEHKWKTQARRLKVTNVLEVTFAETDTKGVQRRVIEKSNLPIVRSHPAQSLVRPLYQFDFH